MRISRVDTVDGTVFEAGFDGGGSVVTDPDTDLMYRTGRRACSFRIRPRPEL